MPALGMAAFQILSCNSGASLENEVCGAVSPPEIGCEVEEAMWTDCEMDLRVIDCEKCGSDCLCRGG